jgi:hypothetical protein
MSQPSLRQLQFLKSLADRTGQTFTYPKTSAQASAEIDRLKHTRPESRSDRRYERKLIADQVATGLNNTAVQSDETTGYGSDAVWRQHRQPPEQISSSHRPAPRKTTPAVGERVELARYTVATGGERVLYGQLVDGRVRVTDRPAGPVDEQHRAHLVENDLESKAELDALVADYLALAQQLQVVPAAAIPFDLASPSSPPDELSTNRILSTATAAIRGVDHSATRARPGLQADDGAQLQTPRPGEVHLRARLPASARWPNSRPTSCNRDKH